MMEEQIIALREQIAEIDQNIDQARVLQTQVQTALGMGEQKHQQKIQQIETIFSTKMAKVADTDPRKQLLGAKIAEIKSAFEQHRQAFLNDIAEYETGIMQLLDQRAHLMKELLGCVA